jgi:hypothetical protein
MYARRCSLCALLILVWAHQARPGDPSLSPQLGTTFTEQAQFGDGPTISVAWYDYDADGNLDVAVSNFQDLDQLFVNNNDGTFTPQTPFAGTPQGSFAIAWADYDNDGDGDLVIGTTGTSSAIVYRNNGDGTFTGTGLLAGPDVIAAAWADYDLDGDLDLALGRGILGTNQINTLYINDGLGNFTRRNEFGANQTQAIVWCDFDNDGDADAAVGNGGFTFIGPNYLYINNGDGTFDDRPEFGAGTGPTGRADTTSLACGDFDNDGDLDVAVGNWDAQQNALYVNNGDLTFTRRDEFGLHDTNTVAWADFNLDGWLDLATGNGDFGSAEQNYIYVNNGDGTFTETALLGMGSTDAIAWGDFDNDGDPDAAAGNEHSPSQNYLYVNNTDSTEYLNVHLVGHYGDRGPRYSNNDAIGAKVIVYEAGFLGDPDHLLGYREIEAHGGFSPQNSVDAMFGLPGHSTVDVRVIWPGSAGVHFTDNLEGVAVGQRLIVHETIPVCTAPADPLPEPTGLTSNRALSLEIPASWSGFHSGIRVRLKRLYVDTTEDPATGCPLRTALPELSAFEGEIRWVGPPQAYPEDSVPAPPDFIAAPLQCCPHFRDWGPDGLVADLGANIDTGLLHIYGAEVVPCSEYEVQVLDRCCVDLEDEGCYTTILTIATSEWGDTWLPQRVVGQPNFVDIGKVVEKYKNYAFDPGPPLAGAPRKVGAMLRGNVPPLADAVTFIDINRTVEAYKSIPYKELGPTACTDPCE